MDKGLRKKAQPFHAFTNAFKILRVAGYAKIVTDNRCAKICHEIYRPLVILIVFTYTLQHFIYVIQVHDDAEKFMEAVVLEIPEFALCLKVVIMYFEADRLDKLNNLIKDPIFEGVSDHDEECIKRNCKIMNRLSKFTIVGLSCVGFFWVTGPIFKRMQDETTVVPSYMPFSMHTWPRFLLANFLDTCTVLWVGYGHFNIDCLIACYYSQAQMQLKIIRYNLEHLFDSDKVENSMMVKKSFEFIDVLDKNVHARFVVFVIRYEKVLWLTNEVNAIFGKAISFQFFMTSISSCLVVYQMSSIDILSVQFMFLLGYYLAAQFQILVYCYYGGLVEYESKFVGNSLYLGEWLSLSPRFRRQLLIAMARWSIPITQRVSGIVPLSLTTFISITRSAYTLYTVLKTKNNRGNGERTLAF